MADAVVRIWMFNWPGKDLLGAGHGSIHVPGNPGLYITWLDGDEDMRSEQKREPNTPLERIIRGTWRFDDDLMKFGGGYDEISIPMADEHTPIGLDRGGIEPWWNRRKANRKAYHMISRKHNCDGTVAQALRAGGGERYVKAPLNILYTGATTLRNWATQLSERINFARRAVQEARVVLEAALPNPRRRERVWSLEEWKRHSAAGALSVRREQVAEIDTQLRQYHTPGRGGAVEMDLLLRMLYLAVDHLKKKRQSQRRWAVAQLGYLLVDRIRAIRPDAVAPNDAQ